MAQVIADQLGVAYEDVTVFEGDSSRGGFGPGAAGSRQGVIGGGACDQGGNLLKTRSSASPRTSSTPMPEALPIENGMVHVAGAREKTRSLREIAEIAYGEPAACRPA
jgi:carbon-monoxide dehydrogenase large subunit